MTSMIEIFVELAKQIPESLSIDTVTKSKLVGKPPNSRQSVKLAKMKTASRDHEADFLEPSG